MFSYIVIQINFMAFNLPEYKVWKVSFFLKSVRYFSILYINEDTDDHLVDRLLFKQGGQLNSLYKLFITNNEK